MTVPSTTILATSTAVLFLTALGILLFVRYRVRFLFRDYTEITNDLHQIAGKLTNGKIARDNDDIVVSGQIDGAVTSIRFSHSESAPGTYIRCHAPVDFSLSFSARTPENSDGDDVYRLNIPGFDMRFVGRTDNRTKTKQFLAQAICLDHLQRLCCSNKTMLRLAEGSIELSEALIPSDTARHVSSHLDSIAVLSKQLGTMPWAPRAKAPAKPVRNLQWLPKFAFVTAIAIVVAALFALAGPSGNVEATSQQSVSQGMVFADGVTVANRDGWRPATTVDLAPEFVSWLKNAGVTPEPQISLDPHGDGSSSLAYLLQADNNPNLRRVIWVVDRQVVCNFMGRIDGIARISRDSMSRISWAEGAAPLKSADGDGLLVVRDHTRHDSATVYFLSQHELHTAIPADTSQISLQ